MSVEYDAEADAAYIRVSDAATVSTQELSDVCVVDLDRDGRLVGIELLSVFGFAGASLHELAAKGLLAQADVARLLQDLRGEVLAA